MQTISKPFTPVAQAVTDRLYNEDKISKGVPVVKLSLLSYYLPMWYSIFIVFVFFN